MADRAVASCGNPEHAKLITIIADQSGLIVQLFAKIQKLEDKLEVAQQTIHNSAVSLNPTAHAPDFAATPDDNYAEQQQQDYSAPALSSYEAKRAQAQGQICNYGSGCTREQCWYEHPASKSSETPKPSTSTSRTSQSQPASSSTKRIKQECKYGVQCTRKQCWFEHPSGWVPPNHAAEESQSQQEFGTKAPAAKAPAAEVADWGAPADSSGWNAAPADDWSTPIDNTWGAPAPASADNGWGNSTETSWNSHPSDRPKFPVNNSRSGSIGMSREGSVSNASINKSQSRVRKARGKGRRTDSESVTTESTPMSPPAQATTPMSAHVESIPAQTPSLPPAESTEQTSSYNDPNTVGEMGTPPLEPSGISPTSEPEAPTTPKALWSDEPNIDVVYYPDPPSNLDESQSSAPEDKDMDPAKDQHTEYVNESLSLDQSAPSDLYSSWGVVGPSASDWGLDPNEFPDPAPTFDNKTSGTKSKAKGKQKESFQTSTTGRNTSSRSSNPAAQTETSTPFTNEPEPEPEPAPEPVLPDPPQGVPEDQIPDWLLGGDEDPHAALGIPRPVSLNPEASSAPPRLAPTNPAPRPPLSKLAGENFPSLSGIIAASKASQSKDDAPARPAFSPRPVGWKITRPSDASSSTSSKSGKGGKSNSWGNK
ncbi:unnamed protein product [Rhizoctonia solani]|uniref:Uncharacterized protein n=1 Tax=Rhizoctonia solani TaxID=456999 RepID=A0A8H3AZX1_9AGAM|nr:unnamed protein product [Rhizoctonia solani]